MTRDRSKEYALGISEGAPQAKQVVDRFLLTRQHLPGCSRWHLLKNLRECLERVLDRNRELIAQIAQTIKASVKHPRSSSERAAQQAARARRKAKHAKVRSAIQEGGSIRAGCSLVRRLDGIAKTQGVSRWLVRQCMRPDEPPPRQFHKRMKSVLDPFEAHLVERWREGCTTASVLCLEIKAQGNKGSCKMVERWVYRQREAMKVTGRDKPVKFPGQGFASRDLAWLLLREGTELSDDARGVRDRFLLAWPELEHVQRLALDLVRMVRVRQDSGFDGWLERLKASAVQELESFAVGLEREKEAVRAALSLPWSKREQPVSDPARQVRFGIKKVLSCEQERASGGRSE